MESSLLIQPTIPSSKLSPQLLSQSDLRQAFPFFNFHLHPDHLNQLEYQLSSFSL